MLIVYPGALYYYGGAYASPYYGAYGYAAASPYYGSYHGAYASPYSHYGGYRGYGYYY